MFIPFVEYDVDATVARKVVMPANHLSQPSVEATKSFTFYVRPEHFNTAQMVVRNELMELLIDNIYRKPVTAELHAEADDLVKEYFEKLRRMNGIYY